MLPATKTVRYITPSVKTTCCFHEQDTTCSKVHTISTIVIPTFQQKSFIIKKINFFYFIAHFFHQTAKNVMVSFLTFQVVNRFQSYYHVHTCSQAECQSLNGASGSVQSSELLDWQNPTAGCSPPICLDGDQTRAPLNGDEWHEA